MTNRVMQHKKTSLAGLTLGVLQLVVQSNELNWRNVVLAIGTVLLGWFAKDK